MMNRGLLLFAMGVFSLFPAGCAWLNTPVGVGTPDVVEPEKSNATARIDSAGPASSVNVRKPGTGTAEPTPPAAVRQPPSTEEGPRHKESPPESAPILTVRMSAAEEARLREQIAQNMSRADEAVGVIRQKALTREQAEDLSVVVDFLKGALAARENDLRRAGTLAEKARILAEELKAAVAR